MFTFKMTTITSCCAVGRRYDQMVGEKVRLDFAHEKITPKRESEFVGRFENVRIYFASVCAIV